MDATVAAVAAELEARPTAWRDARFDRLRRAIARAEAAEPLAASDDDDDDDAEAPPSPVAPTLDDARAALQAGRDADAAAACEAILRDRPDSVRALRTLGAAALRLNDVVRARDALARAQSIDFDEASERLLRECVARVRPTPPPPRRAAAPSPSAAAPAAPRPTPDVADLQAALRDPATLQGVRDMLNDPTLLAAFRDSPLFR